MYKALKKIWTTNKKIQKHQDKQEELRTSLTVFLENWFSTLSEEEKETCDILIGHWKSLRIRDKTSKLSTEGIKPKEKPKQLVSTMR